MHMSDAVKAMLDSLDRLTPARAQQIAQQVMSGEGRDQVTKFAPAVAVDPSQPDHVYVAYRDGGIYASEDGGEQWRRLEVEVADPQDMKIVATR